MRKCFPTRLLPKNAISNGVGSLALISGLSYVFLFVVFAGGVATASDPAKALFEAGDRAVRSGDSMKALLLYSQAAEIDSKNPAYAARKRVLQNSISLARPLQTDPDHALPVAISAPSAPDAPRTAADPAMETMEAAKIASGEIEEMRAANAPARLNGKPGPQSFTLRGEAQAAWTLMGTTYGIEMLFDQNYQALPQLRVDLTDVEMSEAFRTLQAASDSFVIPIDERHAMVARDTPQNRTEFMPAMSVAVPIPERLSVQEAQEISTAVQQTFEIRRITMDAAKRVVYFRDSVPKALAARRMFNQLAQPRAQIEVDIEFLSVSKTSTLSYGLGLPTIAPIIDFGTLPQNIILPTVAQQGGFFAFGGGASLLGLGITNASAFETVTKSTSNLVLRTNVVALDGQPASIHVGNHYPIITNSFTDTSGAAAGQNGTLAPGIQYEDLGLILKLTPSVHENSEVSLDVDAQFKTLGSVSINGIPEIASRQYQGKVRLKEGEWAVIAGLVSTADSETPTGVLGLSQIPLIGGVFRQQTHLQMLDETLVVLKPRLVSLPPWETQIKTLSTGTESRPINAF